LVYQPYTKSNIDLLAYISLPYE